MDNLVVNIKSIIIFLFLFSSICHAQNEFVIKETVIEPENVPEKFKKPKIIDDETKESIMENAELVKNNLSEISGFKLSYNLKSIEWVEGFITRNPDFTLVDTIGSYYGEAIINKYGGSWYLLGNEPIIELNNKHMVFPFRKVISNMENGEEDSISMFYRYIDKLINEK